MTTRRPWYPFNVVDYRADTTHLTTLEHGAYRLLIDEYWMKGGLPDDEKQLRKIAKVSPQMWTAVMHSISPLFLKGWRHKRIEVELARTEKLSAIRRTSANERWSDKDAIAPATECNWNAIAPAIACTVVHRTLKEGSLDLDSPSLPIIDSPSTQLSVSEKPTDANAEKKSTKRKPYPADFETFWAAYPTDANMSKKQAGLAWSRMSPEQRTAATESLPAFRMYCTSRPDYRPVHANRYLTQERFDGHLRTTAKLANRGTFVRRGTPQWNAWVTYWRETGKGNEPPSHNGGWHFQSEWPPRESHDTAH